MLITRVFLSFLLISAVLATEERFSLDENPEVTVYPGGTVYASISADIALAKAWVIHDPDIVRLRLKTERPISSSNKMFGTLDMNLFKISCTRDCKIGETFEIDLDYTALRDKVVIERKKMIVRVVEKSQEL